MCGRFTISVEPGEIGEVLGIESIPDVRKRYNVAPTQTILAASVNDAGKSEAALFHWGLIPVWSEDPKIEYHTSNAKSETAAHKPAFRSAFNRRRWIILRTVSSRGPRSGTKNDRNGFIAKLASRSSLQDFGSVANRNRATRLGQAQL